LTRESESDLALKGEIEVTLEKQKLFLLMHE